MAGRLNRSAIFFGKQPWAFNKPASSFLLYLCDIVPNHEITQLLHQVAAGDRNAEPLLMEMVYAELHRLASAYMRKERREHTLQASALVNEAYVRLLQGEAVSWESRAHFYVAAARTMRRILIDHARNRQAAKRTGGAERVSLDEAFRMVEEAPSRFLDLDTALEKLAQLDARQAKIVELRFFSGLSVEETAAVLALSEKTIKRDWAMARAWLETELEPPSSE